MPIASKELCHASADSRLGLVTIRAAQAPPRPVVFPWTAEADDVRTASVYVVLSSTQSGGHNSADRALACHEGQALPLTSTYAA